MRVGAFALGLLQLACATAADPTPGSVGKDATVDSTTDQWQVSGTQVLPPSGSSAPFAVAAHAGDRSVLVRAFVLPPLPNDSLCVRLTDFQTAQGQPWNDAASLCPACAGAPGSGFAQTLWAATELPVGGMQMRLQVVTCFGAQPVERAAIGVTGPYTVQVQTWHAPLLAGGKGKLNLAFASASDLSPAHAAMWAKPRDHAIALLRATGLEVAERAPVVLPAGTVATPLLLGLGHTGRERKLESAVVTALQGAPAGSGVDPNLLLVVVLAPCLDWVGADGTTQRLLGHSTRMPGGPRGPDGASLVVVGTPDCKPPAAADAVRLGNVLAHEIGHYLGLGHAAAQPPNLMTADVADRGNVALSFAAAQADRLHLNPIVVAP